MGDDNPQLIIEAYPWQAAQQDLLLKLTNASRLHHAFIFHGAEHLGKFDFACAMAALLLCENKNRDQHKQTNLACQNCHACNLVKNMAHPDFFIVRPEKETKPITVDAIRELVEFMSRSSSRQGRRIVIIDQSHRMNSNASNALLKFLEEPGDNVHIFLVCSELDALLPTIRSRCQKLSFVAPEMTDAVDWLKANVEFKVDTALLEYASGSPLLAIKLQNNPVFADRHSILAGLKKLLADNANCMSYASAWSDYSLVFFLTWWHACLVDTLKIKLGADIKQLRFQSLSSELKFFAEAIDAKKIQTFNEELFALRLQLLRAAPFNQGLMLESVLLKWQALAV